MGNLFKLCGRGILTGLVGMTMVIAGCSDDDNGRPSAAVSTGVLAVGSNGRVTADVPAPDGVTLRLNDASLFTNVSSAVTTSSVPVMGNISTTVKRSERTEDLPAAAPSGSGLLAVMLDIKMRSSTLGQIRTIVPPMVDS
ncbi:MAG: hypothetical protein A2079_03075 [Geobacteraceae bacterium GWC2_48_7]|nr:MAG: hypothetical protein A2079_03075 [Geobacteraceae bacterium GWC2_48_7]